MKKYILVFFAVFFVHYIAGAVTPDTCSMVSLQTNYGKIVVKLYPETVKHKKNFLKLVNEGFYDGVLFHRVIKDFMIQAGDPESKTALPGTSLGSGDVGYTISAEIIYPKYYHKKGALAAARQPDNTNPKKASSGCQFYIVEGRVFSDAELNAMENKAMQKLQSKMYRQILNKKQSEVKKYKAEKNQTKLDELSDSIMLEVRIQLQSISSYKFTPQQRIDYTTIGGTPHLDGEYTVFGEVIEGLDVVDKISKIKTGNLDRPVENVKIIKAKYVY